MTARPTPAISQNSQTDMLELRTGDRMNRVEFHRAYQRTPEDFRAELIGGIVYLPSPRILMHGTLHAALDCVLVCYKAQTPGVEASTNTTILLGYDAEPQPDLYTRILPEYGGQSRNSDDDEYVEGAPEFILEIALSNRSIDLHAKRNDYLRNGVMEYLVVCIRERELRWFDLREDRELWLDADKICRVRTFPGMWIDADALLNDDAPRLLATARKGISTPEHAEFVARLAAARKS